MRIVRYLIGRESVDDIINSFDAIHRRLEAHSEKKRNHAEWFRNRVNLLVARANNADKESIRATAIAAKIGELIKAD